MISRNDVVIILTLVAEGHVSAGVIFCHAKELSRKWRKKWNVPEKEAMREVGVVPGDVT